MLQKIAPAQSNCVLAANWWDLRLSLNWCYEGKPLWKKIATHTGVHLVAWHLLEGGVTLESNGKTIRAQKGQWLISRPSKRSNEFTDSARILSIHLAIECAGLDASWSGPAATTLPDDERLGRYAANLQRTSILRGLPQKERRNLIGLSMGLGQALELETAMAEFSRRLFELVMPMGMFFGPPQIRDERVRASRRFLARNGFRDAWSRTALARSHGLSPSQLDRLWRRELGITPRQHWEQRRLEAACFRLQNETAPIKEIAYDLGFSHLSRFSIWFREMKGQSPSSFRNRALVKGS